LAIIGEALNKFRKQELEIQHDKQIIGLRNRLIHAYYSIDDSILWMVLHKYLPELKKEVEEALL